MTLVALSAEVRLFVLVMTIVGFALAIGAMFSAHLNAAAVEHNGALRALARARRASEAWSLVAQTAFLAVGISFIVFSPVIPTVQTQVPLFIDGLLRQAAFGIGALALAMKSLIALISENRIMKSL